MLREESSVSLLLIGRTPLMIEALGVALAFSEHTLVLDAAELSARETIPRAEVLLCEIGSFEDLHNLDGIPTPGAGVALMTKPTQDLVDAVIKRGLVGLVTPLSSLADLHKCIRHAKLGDVYFDEEIQRCLSGVLRRRGEGQLSAREREVAILVAKGQKTRAIATKLRLSAKTVSNHRRNIFRKLQIREAVSLTRYVIDAGWIAPTDRPRLVPRPTAEEDWPHTHAIRRGT
jgi:two-component system uhpT operon response regulator UhpA